MGDTIRKRVRCKGIISGPAEYAELTKKTVNINGMKKNMEILEEAFYAKDH